MIQIVVGDLLENSVQAQALAHGCNCKGVMGAGVAVQLRRKFPFMWESYQQWCKIGIVPGKSYQTWGKEIGKEPVIFCLTTQVTPGPTATLSYVRDALIDMRQSADSIGITCIAMPKIASGIGGLDFEDVLNIIAEVFGDWSGTLYIYLKLEDK